MEVIHLCTTSLQQAADVAEILLLLVLMEALAVAAELI
jgi:hypothetical protein